MVNLLRKLYYFVRNSVASMQTAVRHLARLRTSDAQLSLASQQLWNDTDHDKFQSRAHWRESPVFSDNAIWWQLGESHRVLLDRAISLADLNQLCSVVDWGCGGGMNAVHLAGEVDRYYGVDICQSTLDECQRQVSEEGQSNFYPILIDVSKPEMALNSIPEPVDAFICTYVFELIPTPAYGLRIVKLAHQLLKPGGVALLHIRYANNIFQQSRPWDYRSNLAHNTTYSLKEFRDILATTGFDPLFEKVVPYQAELNERRYAFFAVRRPTGD